MPNNNIYKRKQSSAFQTIPKKCMEFQDLESFLKHFLAHISTAFVSLELSFEEDIKKKASINGNNVDFEATDSTTERRNKAGTLFLQAEYDINLAITNDVSLRFVQSQNGKYKIFLNAEANALGLLTPKEIENIEVSVKQAERLIALALNHRSQNLTEGSCVNNFKEYQSFNFLEKDIFENINQTKGEIFSKNYKKIEVETVNINDYLDEFLETLKEKEYFENLYLKTSLFSKKLLKPEEVEFLDNILAKKGLHIEGSRKTYNELFLNLKKEFLLSSLNNNNYQKIVNGKNTIPKEERPLNLYNYALNIEESLNNANIEESPKMVLNNTIQKQSKWSSNKIRGGIISL